ncbi:MAG TPA: hypothetical protein VGQ02_04875, partial [Candidatus Limnocylindrales bacterium]|nr:hypothetical protein [Candidatus Limnocylindrales bacterium]
FTTQKSWLWCTAAGVQIVRNIVDRDNDHSSSAQRRYFEWMRRHNRYDLPLSAGIDPAGWTAGLRHFVDSRYRLVASKTFSGAVRSAAQRIRATGLPVALTVDNGNHGWILTGFSATADPATTGDFRVTSVRVVGPLYGLQSRTYGYDMKPGTSLTIRQLRRFFTPWWYAPKRMVWDNAYVSIQPVPVKAQIAKSLPVTLPTPLPSVTTSPAASATAAASPSAAAAVAPSSRPDPSPFAAPTASDLATAPAAADVPPIAPIAVLIVLVSAVAIGLGLIARGRSLRSVP